MLLLTCTTLTCSRSVILAWPCGRATCRAACRTVALMTYIYQRIAVVFAPSIFRAKVIYWKSQKTSQIVWCKCFLLQGCCNRGLFTDLPGWKHWDFIKGDDFNCYLFCWYLMGTILLATSNCKSSFLSEVSLRITPERQLEIRIQKTDAKNMSAWKVIKDYPFVHVHMPAVP